jgi:hypothetical protein
MQCAASASSEGRGESTGGCDSDEGGWRRAPLSSRPRVTVIHAAADNQPASHVFEPFDASPIQYRAAPCHAKRARVGRRALSVSRPRKSMHRPTPQATATCRAQRSSSRATGTRGPAQGVARRHAQRGTRTRWRNWEDANEAAAALRRARAARRGVAERPEGRTPRRTRHRDRRGVTARPLSAHEAYDEKTIAGRSGAQPQQQAHKAAR